jgi:hypothetical protein
MMNEVYEMSKRREAERHKEMEERLAQIRKVRRRKARQKRIELIRSKIKTAKTPEMETYWRAQERIFWERGGLDG